jgi:Protein of unknown function (DUF2889)
MSDKSEPGSVRAAMAVPGDAAPPRRPGSIRRTSHIDMLVGEDPGLVLRGRARDLVTTPAGDARPVAQAAVTAGLDTAGTLVSLEVDGGSGDIDALLGRAVSAGFRDAVHAAFPDHIGACTPLALLLDDLPVAALISGYALLYLGQIPAEGARLSMKSDICSGWRAGGTMMASVDAGEGVPVTVGPPAPTIADDIADDPVGWHAVGELPAGAMRRRRLVDVQGIGDTWAVMALFRDTHVDPAGVETVLHEYALTATVDAETGEFTTCRAVPRVLPWVECPVAAASADRLAGQRVEDVRDFVRSSLRGTSTCTHLNDLLRSLGDVASLAATLRTERRNAGSPWGLVPSGGSLLTDATQPDLCSNPDAARPAVSTEPSRARP